MCFAACASVLCSIICAVSLAPLGLLGLLMVPSVLDGATKYSHQHFEGKAFEVANTVLFIRHAVYCMGDYLGCMKPEIGHSLEAIYGLEGGVAMLQLPFLLPTGKPFPMHFSHKSYKEVAYDPAAGRPDDMMVGSNKSSLPPGVLPDGVEHILLNFNTGHPEHTARRKLLADGLPALALKPSKAEVLKVPVGVAASDAAVFGHPLFGLRHMKLKRSVFNTVGLNLFGWLFGADISDHLAEHFEYDSLFAPVVLGAPCSTRSGARLGEIRAGIYAKVAASEGGKKFVELAKSRGMNGTERLQEMVWIAMFAGYGGTSNLAFETVKHALKEPAKYVKLFRQDPDAYMLEAARLFPPVGGMNPYQVTKKTTFKLRTGRTLEMKPGDVGLLFTTNANLDPSIFASPDEFKPGRPNGERLLSWNAEVRDFRKCETVAGCPAAPRGCPGMHLSLRLATKVVGFFMKGIEDALHAEAKQGEL